MRAGKLVTSRTLPRRSHSCYGKHRLVEPEHQQLSRLPRAATLHKERATALQTRHTICKGLSLPFSRAERKHFQSPWVGKLREDPHILHLKIEGGGSSREILPSNHAIDRDGNLVREAKGRRSASTSNSHYPLEELGTLLADVEVRAIGRDLWAVPRAVCCFVEPKRHPLCRERRSSVQNSAVQNCASTVTWSVLCNVQP